MLKIWTTVSCEPAEVFRIYIRRCGNQWRQVVAPIKLL